MTHEDKRRIDRMRWGALCACVPFIVDGALAAVTLDGTLGPARSLTGPDYVIPARLGETRGSNLFHSFGQFSLTRSESATFTGPARIQNIIGRVTGGEVSDIDGLVRSSITGANLYLINPSGVMFGPNARLDVSGSFYASSADYLRLADGGRFDARNPGASMLTSAPPSAFGFLGRPAPITVSGALSVPTGKTLGLVGGSITVSGEQAILDAPSGRIGLVAVASAGEVAVSPSAPDVSAFTALGDVVINGGALVSTAGDPGGTIYIRGGRLVVESALLDSGTLGAADHPGVGIDIAVRGEFALGVSPDLSAPDGRIDSSSLGAGRAGDIRIDAGSFTLAGDPTVSVGAPEGRFAQVASGAFDLGRGGNIVVNAGQLEIGSNASIVTQSLGAGDAGGISVNANSLRVDGGAGFGSFISSSGDGGGVAGGLNISASDVLLQGGHVGLFIDTLDKSGRDSGSLTLTAHNLRILDGAQIYTTHIGAGSGGNINVTADDIFIAGRDALGNTAGIFSNVLGPGAGAAGNITVAAGSLAMSRNGMIESEVDSNSAGNIRITAQSIELSDGALLRVFGLGPEFGGISIDAARVQLTGGTGGQTGIVVGVGAGVALRGADVVGGGIRIDSGELQVLDGAEIISGSRFSAGPIQIYSDRVLVAGRDAVSGEGSSVVALASSEINIEARELVVRDSGVIGVESAFGFGGHLRIAADNISLSRAALFANDTFVGGSAGNIDVIARGALSMQDSEIRATAVNSTGGNVTIAAGSAVNLENSSISASVVGFGGGGGGNVHVAADTISLSGHSSISATASVSDGTAGNIELAARNALYMRDSEISTQAAGSADVNSRVFGGNITVAAGSMIDLNSSAITASVRSGTGNGGNISIDPEFVVLNHSRIAADAIGGNGGNVTIVAGNFLASSDSSVTASSAVGLQGNVVIRAPTQDLSGDLAKLPETVLDASTRFKSNCAAVGSRFSSFTVSGPSLASPGSGGMPSAYSGINAAIGPVVQGDRVPRSASLLASASTSPAKGCGL